MRKNMGNTRKQLISLGAVNPQETKDFALSGRFGNDMHTIHITNLRERAKNPKIREIFSQICVRRKTDFIECITTHFGWS